MTSRAYWLFPNTFVSFALAACLGLSACGSLSDAFYPSTPPVDAAASPTREQSKKGENSSQYEWAVQYFEAGSYDKAITQFRKIQAHGANVQNFELIPFYIGMSQFHLGQNAEATVSLERFLKLGTSRLESQEARLALLAIFERTSQWDRVLGLAAETDALTLFQENRAFLKLVWARALSEKGEIKGAKSVLKDASQYLDMGQEDRTIGPDRDKDLWGRYYFTTLMLQRSECTSLGPREIGAGKSKKKLYQPWLEGTVDCLRGLIDSLVFDLIKGESGWAEPGVELAKQSLDLFAAKLETLRQEEKGRLRIRRALDDGARQQIYRLLTKLDEHIKNLKNQGTETPSLEPLRKQIDHLLVSLASPS